MHRVDIRKLMQSFCVRHALSMQRPGTSFDHNYGVANMHQWECKAILHTEPSFISGRNLGLYAMSRMSRKVSCGWSHFGPYTR